MNTVISNVEQYRLLIEGDLLALIRQAMELEKKLTKKQLKGKAYRKCRAKLENKLYDIYQEIGWSVVYDMNELPF